MSSFIQASTTKRPRFSSQSSVLSSRTFDTHRCRRKHSHRQNQRNTARTRYTHCQSFLLRFRRPARLCHSIYELLSVFMKNRTCSLQLCSPAKHQEYRQGHPSTFGGIYYRPINCQMRIQWDRSIAPAKHQRLPSSSHADLLRVYTVACVVHCIR
jgi:hypothetical protein